MKSLHKKEEKENNSKTLLGKVYSNFAAPVAFAELGSSLHYDRFVPARSSAEESAESSPVGRSCRQGPRPGQGEAGILTSTQPAW